MANKALAGWIYMIIGLAIMGYTKFIQSKQPSAKIGFFFWVGLVFLIYGILKEVVPKVMGKPEKKPPAGPPPQQRPIQNHLHPAGNPQHAVSTHMTHQHVRPQTHPSHPYQPAHKQCPRCKQLTHGQGKFCHNCGHQFF